METLWQDIKYGARMLVKNPGFTVVAVLTMALGIGANSAIFSVINTVLLRPLPYEDSERLMLFTEWAEEIPNMSFSVANFKDVRDQNSTFESVVAFRSNNYVLTGEGDPERLSGRQVTAGMFSTLRLRPVLGRPFTAEEDKPGAERVVLLGEGFWTRRFGRDPNVLGKHLALNGESYTVIGVLPSSMHGTWRQTDIFTSLLRLEDQIGESRGNHPGIYVIGRRKDGVVEAQARAEIIGIAKRLSEQYPSSNARQSMTAESLHRVVVGDLRPALLVLLGAVAFVLLICCVNVANLLLGRGAARQREIAVRAALGAGRGRLIRQLLTESILLALVGGALGLLIAYIGVRGLLAATPRNVPLIEQVRIDGMVLGFNGLISLLTGLLFGLVPAWQVSRADLHGTLKEGSRGSAGSAQHRMRNVLVVAEIALSMILLAGAGLMLRSFFRVLAADPGFNPEGVLTANVSVPQTKYNEPAKVRMFIDQVIDKAKALPGVQYAGSTLPLLGGWQTAFSVEGRPEPPPGQLPSTDINRVSPDYFRAMGVRLLSGRFFSEQDHGDALLVCIIDETFAKTFWPGENPIGRKIKLGGSRNPEARPLEIVGVVAHVKNYGVDQTSRVETYLPYKQSPFASFTLLVRTTGDPGALTSAVRQAVRSTDPEVPIFNVRTMESLVSDSVAQRRLAAVLLSVFAGLALVLAAVGIYGVMSYAVTQRTQEIGIRMALGAKHADIVKMVVRQGMVLAVIGVVVGLGLALGLAQLIERLLFQVSASDPPTFSVVPLILAAVALLACYIPARRATRVDPMIALRYE